MVVFSLAIVLSGHYVELSPLAPLGPCTLRERAINGRFNGGSQCVRICPNFEVFL